MGESNPTIEGRRHIVQMVIAGMMQYLFQVQGMPPRVKKLLMRRLISFMWSGKKSQMNADTLFRPLDEEEKALVDIRMRNKAIDIMWLKSYLKIGQERPIWAYVADAIMAGSMLKSEESIDNRVKVLPLLQSWRTRVSPQKEVCPDIVKLINTAKDFNVRLNGIAFSRNVMQELPIWFHFAVDPKLRRITRGKTVECLISKHKVRMVGDAETLFMHLRVQNH